MHGVAAAPNHTHHLEQARGTCSRDMRYGGSAWTCMCSLGRLLQQWHAKTSSQR